MPYPCFRQRTSLAKTTMPDQQPTDLNQRFQGLTQLLDQHGVLAGTGHKRITIPKNKLTEQDLGTLGFEPVLAAIPEAGQDRFQSFRHPDNLYHIHSHGDRWTMHQDRHAAATMLARTQGAAKAFVQGIPHVITEGIPGLGYYIKGQLGGRKSTADIVNSQLQPDNHVKNYLDTMPDSSTYQKAAALVNTRLKKRQRGFYFEPEPGFHDVKGKFDDASRQNTETKVAAVYDVLQRFGLAKLADENNPDCIETLTKVLREADFGFDLQPGASRNSRDKGRNHGNLASWATPGGPGTMASEAFDARGGQFG